jgi:acyl-ACP thioesterase
MKNDVFRNVTSSILLEVNYVSAENISSIFRIEEFLKKITIKTQAANKASRYSETRFRYREVKGRVVGSKMRKGR